MRHLVRWYILFAFAWRVTCALLFAFQWASDDTRFHWDCNLPGDCRHIVLHLDICPGALPCVDKAMCSHYILQVTTVDSPTDAKCNFQQNSAVDKRQQGLRLILPSRDLRDAGPHQEPGLGMARCTSEQGAF